MAMKKLGERNGIVVYKGSFPEDKTLENKVRMSAHLTPEQRMHAVAVMSLWPLQTKGLDIDARRLDRSIQIVKRK